MLSVAQLQVLPKIELHCHLDGSVSPKVIYRLAQQQGIALPARWSDFLKLVQVPEHVRDLGAYIHCFDFVLTLLQTAPALTAAAYDVVAQAAQDHVRYIEVRFAPELHTQQGLTLNEIISAVITGLHQAQADFGVTAAALVCGMVTSPLATAKATFTAAQPFLGRGVAGGDFAGNEAASSPAALAPAVKMAQKLGLPMTLHTGECHCATSVLETAALGVKRLGHGIAIAEDKAALSKLAQHDVVLELCLSSNLQTQAVSSLAAYPVKALQASGISFTINTDNRTVSHTTLTREYALWQAAFNFGRADFLRANQQAVAVAFCDPATKTRLYAELKLGYGR